jgi:hypothetical protein
MASGRGRLLAGVSKGEHQRMAHFVMVKLSGGEPVWINVDQVRYVASDDGRTTAVHFTKHHSILVEGPPAVVVNTRRRGGKD